MTALQYHMPIKDKLECTNPICEELADFVIHWQGTKTPCCLKHLSQYEKPGARLEKLLIAGKANVTGGASD
jgi:hypothetical protein